MDKPRTLSVDTERFARAWLAVATAALNRTAIRPCRRWWEVGDG